MRNLINGTVSNYDGVIDCAISATPTVIGEISHWINTGEKYQSKTVTPSDELQTVSADAGYNGLSMVKVNPIPSNYGKITWNGIYLKVE